MMTLSTKNSRCICLPFELEREICGFAVSSFPGCVPRIILVARRFQDWFKLELYRIIISTSETIIPPVLYSSPSRRHGCLNTEHLATYGHLVRYAFFQACSPRHVADILVFCPNLENIALRGVEGPDCRPLLIPAFENLAKRGKLKHLGASFDHFMFYGNKPGDFLPFASPAFSSLTHLVMLRSWSSIPDWSRLANLPCLTHLAIINNISSSSSYMENLLSHCKHLRLLALVDIRHNRGAVQNRVVTLDGEDCPAGASIYLSEHWKRSVMGEADLWSIAGRLAKNWREEDSGIRMVSFELLFTEPDTIHSISAIA